jgi:hypothetical protein
MIGSGVPVQIAASGPFSDDGQRLIRLVGRYVRKIRFTSEPPTWCCGFKFNEWHR